MTNDNGETGEQPDVQMTVLRRGKPDIDPLLYKPTQKEAALLEVLLNPDFQSESITRQCERAGISRETFYQMMRREHFTAHYYALLREAVRLRGAELVAIGMKFARQGSFPHYKMLMQMGGIFDEKAELMRGAGDIAEITIRFADPNEGDA